MPYKSQKQNAWMHIHLPEIAKRWDKEFSNPIPWYLKLGLVLGSFGVGWMIFKPKEVQAATMKTKPVPEGYKYAKDPLPQEVTSKSVSLLSQPYGYEETSVIDGRTFLFRIEPHTWYGADPSKPPTPHKGVTVFEKVI
jgi:hypothetical protein